MLQKLIEKPNEKIDLALSTLIKKSEEMKQEMRQFGVAHLRATQSNKDLQNAVAVHSENLKLLSLPLKELKTKLPTPSIDPSKHNEY